MAESIFPWQSDCKGGIQSYARALDQGPRRGPDPKTVFLLRMVNGWYGWNQGPSPLFGRDPRGISSGRYTGQQGAFLQQIASNTYSNGNHPSDTMTWSPLTGIPQTSRGDGWFVAYSDSGYTRYDLDITKGIFRPPSQYISNFSAYHMHSGFFPLGGGVTGTWDIVLEVPVDMGDIIEPMKSTYGTTATNHARFDALAAGGKLLLGFNDFPVPNVSNEFDLGTVNTAGYDGSLMSVPNRSTWPYNGLSSFVPGGIEAIDCSFYVFELNGFRPVVLMAQSEVVVNTPYILVDWLQMVNASTNAIFYTYLSATEHPAPAGGKVIIPLPDMTLFPEVAGSLFKVNWQTAPFPNGVVRHLIPGQTIDTWTAAGQPF